MLSNGAYKELMSTEIRFEKQNMKTRNLKRVILHSCSATAEDDDDMAELAAWAS